MSETNAVKDESERIEVERLQPVVMCFSMTHLVFDVEPENFTEDSAPDWLTSCKTIKGSTMDDRWWWEDYVKNLDIGESIESDFRKITRTA
jgi:hypothetical protein